MEAEMDEGDASRPYLPSAPTLPDMGLLIDAGHQRRKHIDRLKWGKGRLAREMQATLYSAGKELGIDSATEIVPVILLYRCTDTDYTVITPQA